MAEKIWIALSDYSRKHKVSISTLRRRIKNQEVDYQLEEGKYLLRDLPPEALRKQEVEVPAPSSPQPQVQVPKPPPAPSTERVEVQLLLSELKKAYAIILQEKEELILQLKEEVTDLKTLVQVLEDENDRLKNVIRDNASLDHWLKSTNAEPEERG